MGCWIIGTNTNVVSAEVAHRILKYKKLLLKLDTLVMREPYLVLTPKELVEYIQNDVDIFGGGGMPNKMYEFLTALILARFHLKQTGQYSNFIFPLRKDHENINSVAEMMESHLQEDTPIDILLVNADMPTDKNPKGKTKSTAFQLKRFNLHNANSTPRLIDYLINKIPRRYSQVQATLVLLFEGGGEINIKEINQAIDSLENYPFPNIMHISGRGDSEVTIGEIWPTNGLSTFPKKEWFKDLLPGESDSDI